MWKSLSRIQVEPLDRPKALTKKCMMIMMTSVESIVFFIFDWSPSWDRLRC
jgi:hypothetical protein